MRFQARFTPRQGNTPGGGACLCLGTPTCLPLASVAAIAPDTHRRAKKGALARWKGLHPQARRVVGGGRAIAETGRGAADRTTAETVVVAHAHPSSPMSQRGVT